MLDKFALAAVAIALSLFWAGCGGSGGSSDETHNDDTGQSSSSVTTTRSTTTPSSTQTRLGQQAARAGSHVDLYCIKTIGYRIGRNPAPSNTLIKAKVDGVDLLSSLAAKSPELRVGDKTVREVVLKTVEALRNGNCDVGAAGTLEAALGR